VHVTMGRLSGTAPQPSAVPSQSTPASAPRTEAASRQAPVTTPPRTHTPGESRVGVQGAQGTTTISHVIGVGGLVQSARGFGATGRAWHGDRLGLELRLTRSTMTSDAAAGRMTSVEFEPRVVYALFDHVSDYVWFRPYLGSGVSFHHQSLKVSASDGASEASDNGVGYRLFAGSELTFASVQRFGLSVEFGYRDVPAPFQGFEAGKMSGALVGHWYVK